MNMPIAGIQQQENSPAAIQNSDSMAHFLPSRGAASARKGSSDVQRRKKNRRVERAKQLIRDYGNGERIANGELASCTLYVGEYRQLLEEISDDDTLSIIFSSDLRYDYTADNRGKNQKRSKQFAVRMPTSFHERISDEIDEAIKDWKSDIAKGRAQCGTGICSGQYCTDKHTREIAKNLKGHRSESLNNSEKKESDKKDPDLSYELEGYNTDDDELDDDESDDNELDDDDSDTDELSWPGIVVEVGWAQSSSALHKKCEWYIKNSKGKTRTVIGVDLHDLYQCYPKPKTEPRGTSKRQKIRATKTDIAKMTDATKKKKALGKIFLWRAETDSNNQVKAVLDEKPYIFRDENGEAAGEVAFRLCLEDFIPAKVSERIGASHNPELAIMAQPLCDRFDTALRAQIPRDRDRELKEKEKKKKEKGAARENSTQEYAQDQGINTAMTPTRTTAAAVAPVSVPIPTPTQSTHSFKRFSWLRSGRNRK